MGACSFSSFATAFPFLNVRLHLWRWRHPVRVFERFPTIVRLETNSGVTQWLHFRSLWEDMGKLSILSKKVRFSKLPYEAFKILELIKKQHKQKLIDSVWDYLAEMLDRIGWESFCWAFARELAKTRESFGWPLQTSDFILHPMHAKKHASRHLLWQYRSTVSLRNSFKFLLFLKCSNVQSCTHATRLTMPSWPSCLGSKQSNTVTTTLNIKSAKTYRNGNYLVSCLYRWTFRCWTQDSVVKLISGISRLNTGHSKPLRWSQLDLHFWRPALLHQFSNLLGLLLYQTM